MGGDVEGAVGGVHAEAVNVRDTRIAHRERRPVVPPGEADPGPDQGGDGDDDGSDEETPIPAALGWSARAAT